MNKIIYILLLFLALSVSCNDNLEDELFAKHTYILKNGWQEIDLEIDEDNMAMLPIHLGVSGTSNNDKDIHLKIAADADTLVGYNRDKYKNAVEQYYTELPSSSYVFDSESYQITKGKENATALIKIDLDELANVDIYDQYVLPITIASSEGEPIGLKKNATVLALLNFSNIFSGKYGGTSSVKFTEGNQEFVETVSGVVLYGTSSTSCYFYAGNKTRISHDAPKYVIDVEMGDNEVLTLSARNTALELEPLSSSIARTYEIKINDSRYYIETSIITLKYKYKDQGEDEDITYTFEGSSSKKKDVLREDYPNVEVTED